MDTLIAPLPRLRADPAPVAASGIFDPDALLASAGASLMVLAPHPDDETLAAGGLIQRALVRGARVSVVFASDGENNPWPQRALERRVWIGPCQRAAWAARRRAEADASLRILGPGRIRVHRLGWPDGAVTRELVADSGPMLNRLRELIVDERPTLLVRPVLHDRHPDHSALHVLAETALQCMPHDLRPLCLGYLLHGRARADAWPRMTLALTAAEQAGKRMAIEAHASQLALARARLMRCAADEEAFSVEPADHDHAGPRLPWSPPRPLRSALVLLVVDADGLVSLLPGDGGTRLCWGDGRLAAGLPRSLRPPFYIKLVCPLRSPWIYDLWGWCRFGAAGAVNPI